jgi:large subunit ribosomal protein L22
VSTVATDDRQRVRAQAKWVRTSARKARIVLDHIRGRSVPEARTILAFTPRAAATDIEKVLRSAVANAEANMGLDGDELLVEAAYADEGPTLKRWKPRARGRVNRIRKRTCHVTLVLVEQPEERAPRRRRTQAQTAEQETPTTTTKPTRRRRRTQAAAPDEKSTTSAPQATEPAEKGESA